MSTKLSHPYKDHPEPWQWPEERLEEMEELYQWFVINFSPPTQHVNICRFF
jgi:hypothetical protein